MERGSYTDNYSLLKPAREDFYRVEDFNQNADIIDSELKKLNDKDNSLDNKMDSVDSELKNLSDEDKNINNKIGSLANVARSGSYNDLINKPKSLERTKLTKANDLNNITEAGGYYFAAGDVPQNVPQGLNINCVLDVSYSKDINTVIQILYKLTGGVPEIYIRRCFNSSWSDWLKYSNDSVSMDYNNLSNKPDSLPANGGNADTVDGKHSSQFVKYDNEHYGQETDLRACVIEGIYRCAVFYDGEEHKGGANGGRNMPGGGDGQAMMIVHFYNGNTNGDGYIGRDNYWLNQIVYRPGSGHLYFRVVQGTSISDWILLNDDAKNIPETAKKLRTEIIIRSYNTPSTANGYNYADYTCTSTNARSVIQSAVDSAAAGSTIVLLKGDYNVNCYENDVASPIVINKNLTIKGVSPEDTVLRQIGDTSDGEEGSLFKITANSDGGNVKFMDMRIHTGEEIASPNPLFTGNNYGVNGTINNVMWENIYFIINNSNIAEYGDVSIANNVLKYCRMINCKIFKHSGSQNTDDLLIRTGSKGVIISNMLNSGYGYFNVSCDDEAAKKECVFSGNHLTRLKVGSGSYTNI